MKTLEKISVSIVNFNSGDYLIKCLESLKKSSDVKLDIWVADNGSVDDSLTKAQVKFPYIHYIKNNKNLGFTKAHNQVFKKITSEYVLILNPDTETLPNTLSYILSYMNSHQNVGAASCKVEHENGMLDWASHRGFPSPWTSFLYYVLENDSKYHLTTKNLHYEHEVDAITGAFFFTRKSVLEKVGYFDEDYFMYGEDLDLCYKIKRIGLKVMYLPEVSIIHHKGISSGIKKHSSHVTTATLESKKMAIDYFYKAMKIFYKKHLEKSYPFFVNWLIYLGINIKWFLAKRRLSV